jgi:hypothetical protein
MGFVGVMIHQLSGLFSQIKPSLRHDQATNFAG